MFLKLDLIFSNISDEVNYPLPAMFLIVLLHITTMLRILLCATQVVTIDLHHTF